MVMRVGGPQGVLGYRRPAPAAMSASVRSGSAPKAMAATRSVLASSTPPAQINVADCGAKGDGKTDDTRAFEKAIAQAERLHCPVYVPPGTYRLSKTLNLQGVAMIGPAGGAWPADKDALPVLEPVQKNTPCVALGSGASLEGLCIRYASPPTNGAPAVVLKGGGITLDRLKIANAWDGISSDGASNVGRLNVSNVFMVDVRNVGVRLTGTWDFSSLRNIEVWNGSENSYARNSGVGFQLGLNAGLSLEDCTVFGMGTGYQLPQNLPHSKIQGHTWATMNGCFADLCVNGIEVQSGANLTVTGGSFHDDHTALEVNGSGARVTVRGADLRSNSGPVVDVQQCADAVITGNNLLRLMPRFGAPAVLLRGGPTVLGNNDIESDGAGVELAKGLQSAAVNGNLIASRGKAVLEEAGKGARVNVSGNVFEGPPKP